MASLVQAFRARRHDANDQPDPALDAELASALGRARAAWPDVSISDEAFAAELAARIPAEEQPLDALRAMRVEDVYLAVACAAGDAAAIAEVERRYVPELHRALGGMGLSAVSEEAVQAMREELFVGAPGTPPRIANYSGRGDLRHWLRVVAGRMGLRLAAAKPRAEMPLQDSGAIAASADVEIDYLKRTYGEAFRPAFREALESLTSRERLLLKQRFSHHLSLDEVAAMNGVHASTVSRWVADAREKLVTATRERMMTRLNVGRAEAESILRLIQSQLDVTLSSLAPRDADP